MLRKTAVHLGLLLIVLTTLVGCDKRGESERFGKTYYLDGAGNWGFGADTIPAGLRQAGYQGNIEQYIWTMSFNPLLDQLVTGNAKVKAELLARKMDDYASRYPDQKINVIALSAGTGVAMWAIENTRVARINNVILLGSSLSSDFDTRPALRRIDGNVYVYSSPKDGVLEIVRTVGTIDGQHGVSSAGAVGLHPPGRDYGKIVNIYWNENWRRYGWNGTHTDCTNTPFVRHELSKHIVPRNLNATRYTARPRRGVNYN